MTLFKVEQSKDGVRAIFFINDYIHSFYVIMDIERGSI